jgi:hypothetical protein
MLPLGRHRLSRYQVGSKLFCVYMSLSIVWPLLAVDENMSNFLFLATLKRMSINVYYTDQK